MATPELDGGGSAQRDPRCRNTSVPLLFREGVSFSPQRRGYEADAGTMNTPALFEDTRGTATVEYVFLFTGMTIGVAAALLVVGPELLALYQLRVAWLALPIP